MKLFNLLVLSIMACGEKEEGPIDVDNDGFSEADDCNDIIASVNPSASDVYGDDIDQNCDGVDGVDADGDGVASVESGGDDCDDDNVDITIGDTWFTDLDGDGFGNDDDSTVSCEQPSGSASQGGDCDDLNPDVNPDAQEICDGRDNDCDSDIDDADSSIDSSTQVTVFSDIDGDGYGNPDSEMTLCEAPENAVENSDDCNDTDASIRPFAGETIADGIDQNCDGEEICYLDADNDGYGIDSITIITVDANGSTNCDDVEGASSTLDDCDDSDASINPGAITMYADNDADGFGGETMTSSCDENGTMITGDCDDNSSSINPDATDIVGDSIDQNCDLVDGTDSDDDGYASSESGGDDCDDTDANTNPLTAEICDGIDNNCDGLVDDDDPAVDASAGITVYADTDEDGFGDANNAMMVCIEAEGYTADNTDCDDSDAYTFPGAAYLQDPSSCLTDADEDGWAVGGDTCYRIEMTDTWGDGWNGNAITVVEDGIEVATFSLASGSEGDDSYCAVEGAAVDFYFVAGQYTTEIGYVLSAPDGAELLNESAPGYTDGNLMTSSIAVAGVGDCDDSNALAFPGAALNDSITDCLIDADGDGYGDSTPGGSIGSGSDCDDSNAAINTAATDIVGDGLDQNCDNVDGTDVDGDGDASIASGGSDCDDGDANVTSATDADADGVTCVSDCDDDDASIAPGAFDQPGDGIDQDCSGGDANYIPYIGNYSVDNDATANALCSYYDVVYGDLSINVSNISSNNTDGLSCLREVYGNVSISGDGSSSASLDNLENVTGQLYLYGMAEASFLSLAEVDRLNFEDYYGAIIDGDTMFPVLTSANQIQFQFPVATSAIYGFSGITELDELYIWEDYSNGVLIEVDGFSNLTTINNEFYIQWTSALSRIAGFDSLTTVGTLVVGYNSSLNDLSALSGITSMPYVDLRMTAAGSASNINHCDFITLDNIGYSFELEGMVYDENDCDVDGDSYSLNDGDCDDRDPLLSLDDRDGDGFNGCEDGDCDDSDASIYPGAPETWYDGIDSDCAQDDDYDQDADGDQSDQHGGTDCDDLDPTLEGLDQDGDGLSTCDGDTVELVSSCQEWYDLGETNTDWYDILLSDGSIGSVYCDMQLNAGYGLFAITDATTCAEDLEYGPNDMSALSSYLSTMQADATVSEFLQYFATDGQNIDVIIIWSFDTPLPMAELLVTANLQGVTVNWTVIDLNGQQQLDYSGTWWFSNNADLTVANLLRGGSNFSSDDGMWGANNGTVDGNDGGNIAWGHGNYNLSDEDQCKLGYLDGTASEYPNLVNFMFFR